MHPLRRPCLTPFARRCRAATLILAPLRVARDTRCPRSFHAPSLPPPRGALRRSGHRPGFGHGTAALAAVPRPAHGAGHLAAVIPTHFVVGIHGWARVELARPAPAGLARLCLGRNSLGNPRGPVPAFGRQSGPREDRRGSSRRPAALLSSGGGARGNAVRGTPPRAQPASDPRSSRHASRSGLTHAHRSNSPKTANFHRCLSVRAFQGHFSGQNRSLWG